MNANELPTTTDERKGGTSASNAHADSLCPGRFLAQRGIEPEPESDDAGTGRRIHAALCVTGDKDFQTLNPEEHKTASECREVEQAISLQFFGDQKDATTGKLLPMKVWREFRFFMPWDGAPVKVAPHSGKPDVIKRVAKRALVIEYKALWGDVPVSSRNLQLRDQVVLVAANIPLLDEIGAVVIQPNITRKPEICLYTKDDLMKAAVDIYERVKASNNPESPRVPGEVQCKFCLAKTRCAEYSKWATALVPFNFTDLPMAQWGPEKKAQAADLLPVAQKYLDELKDFLKKSLEFDPLSVPGWQLEAGATKTAITDPQACFDRLQPLGVTLADFMACISVKKMRLKEAYKKATNGAGTEKQFNKLLDGIVATKQDAPSLAKVKEGK
jgi:hypothetical protein